MIPEDSGLWLSLDGEVSLNCREAVTSGDRQRLLTQKLELQRKRRAI